MFQEIMLTTVSVIAIVLAVFALIFGGAKLWFFIGVDRDDD